MANCMGACMRKQRHIVRFMTQQEKQASFPACKCRDSSRQSSMETFERQDMKQPLLLITYMYQHNPSLNPVLRMHTQDNYDKLAAQEQYSNEVYSTFCNYMYIQVHIQVHLSNTHEPAPPPPPHSTCILAQYCYVACVGYIPQFGSCSLSSSWYSLRRRQQPITHVTLYQISQHYVQCTLYIWQSQVEFRYYSVV